jgi:uroporphyrinogen-III synthase
VVISPVVEIRALPSPADPAAYAGVVFTSENAVAALARPGGGQRAWCVGGRTAQAARAAGFDTVAAGGDAAALVEEIRAAGARGPLLHARGAETRGAVARRLTEAGIRCDEAVVYDQRSVPLSAEARALLAGPGPVLVALFSPNSAARLARALADAQVRAPLRLAALSGAVADAWTGPPPERLAVAARPEAAAMVAALRSLAGAP